MALTNVGMALEFAGKLEGRLEAVYHQCLDSADDGQIKEHARWLIEASQI